MAIVLDGTGSITGLTSGAGIAAAALSGQVPDANAPSGSVVQVVAVQSTTQVSISTSGAQSIGLSTSMTVSANSKVFMSSVVPFFNDGSGGSWSNAGTSSLWVDGVQVAFTEHTGTVTGEAAAWTNPCQFLTASLTAGAHTFEVKHGRTIGSTQICMRDGRVGSLVLMEIAA
jgi:hypothetical protein